MTEQPRREDSRIVCEQKVAGPQEARQIADRRVLDRA
jgi:hypothetical protein